MVHAFGRQSATPDVHVVGIDNVACGRMAAETLIGARLPRGWAFWAGRRRPHRPRTARRGFWRAGRASRRSRSAVSFAGDYTFDAGRAEMQRLLAAGPGRGLFLRRRCAGHRRAQRDRARPGLSVPGDVGLIGLNDMEMARWQKIGLTTIRQPVAEIIAGRDRPDGGDASRPPDRPPETRAVSLPGDRTRAPCAPCRSAEHRRAGVHPGPVGLGRGHRAHAPPPSTAARRSPWDRSAPGRRRPSRARMASARSQ